VNISWRHKVSVTVIGVVLSVHWVVYICLIRHVLFYQVSDVENVLDVVQHSENIQIIAEAYDIALDITLPEGNI